MEKVNSSDHRQLLDRFLVEDKEEAKDNHVLGP